MDESSSGEVPPSEVADKETEVSKKPAARKAAPKKKQKKEQELPDAEHTSLGSCKGNEDDEEDDGPVPDTGSRRGRKKEKEEKKERSRRGSKKDKDKDAKKKSRKGNKRDASVDDSTSVDADKNHEKKTVSEHMLADAFMRASEAETAALASLEVGVLVLAYTSSFLKFMIKH